MKLYLAQHGEAVAKDVDPGRPLSQKGELDVRRMAEFLKRHGVTVDNIWHSGKMRAHQTAEILGEALLLRGEVEASGGINPDDAVEDFSITVHQLKGNALVVGHLPFMSRMVSYLVTGNQDRDVVAYKPGSVVCLAQDPDRSWHIQWMLRPDLLGPNKT